MAIITKTINGYGPYRYRVTYEDGEHHWEYLGPTGDSDGASDDGQDVTNDDQQDDIEMEYDADYFHPETETLIGSDQKEVDMDEIVSQLDEGDLIRLNGTTYTVDRFDDGGFGPTGIKTSENGTIEILSEGLDEKGKTLEKVTEDYDPTWEHRAVRFGPTKEKTEAWNLEEHGTSNLSITKPTDADRDTVLVESPYEAKNDIKSLADEGYDPTWNGNQWEVSMNAVPELVTKLRESDADRTGVEVSADILAESGAVDELAEAKEMLDELDG